MQRDLQHWSLRDAIDAFRLHHQAQRYRQSTLVYYANRLPIFAAWLEGEGVRTVDGITGRHVRAYLAQRAETASGHYLHGIARALRAWLNFCVAEEMIAASPMANVPMPRRPTKILPAFAAEDVRRLVRAADGDRERALVHLLLDTGLRASECLRLRVADVSIATGSVMVRAGKGEKDRVAYIGATTSRYLLRYIRRTQLAAAAPLWPSERGGKALGYSGLAKVLRDLGKRAGVQPCTAHTFRRTFALNSLRNGMNVYTLAQLMGHGDIDILRQYLDLVESDLESASRQFGVVDHL